MKAYLLVFDTAQTTRDQVIKIIDRIPPVENWSAFFENVICLASNKDAKSLSHLVREEFPKLRFVITEVEPQNKAGWLPQSIWEFLNHPESAHRKADA